MEENRKTGSDVSLELLRGRENDPKIPMPETPPIWFSKRLMTSIVVFFGFLNSAVIRNNINIAVVEMTSEKEIAMENSTITKVPEFDWDSTTTGAIISIHSYGGLLSFFGGFLVNKFGGSVTCASSMVMAGITILLYPATLKINFYSFLACRFLTGLFEALFYVSTTDIFSRWFPKKERSRLISLSFNGSHIGSAIVYPFCGYLAHRWGWQMVFYVTGIMCLLTSSVHLILVRNRPSQDKWISDKELVYLQEQTDDAAKRKVTQEYKNVLLSIPVWALCFSKLAYMWVAYTILGACFPLYVKDQTQKSTEEIGFISSIPSIVYIIMLPVAGTLMDYWKNHSSVTTTRIHKIIMSVACCCGAILFIATTLNSNFYTSLGFFVLIQAMLSFVALIIQLVTVNVTPNNSSTVAGLATIFSCLSSIISRTLTGYMITNHSIQEWNNCFLLAAGVLVFGAVAFTLLGSSEPHQSSTSSHPQEQNHSSNKE